MSSKKATKTVDKEKCYSQANVPCAEPVIVKESQIKNKKTQIIIDKLILLSIIIL